VLIGGSIQLNWRTPGKARSMLTCCGDIEYVISQLRLPAEGDQ
jgi:hypothetical protein